MQLDRNTIIGVRLGQNIVFDEAFDAIREYERFLNTRTSSGDPLDLTSIVRNIGKYKCLPLLGDKGEIQDMTPPPPEVGQIQDILDLRSSIISSVGLHP